MKDIIITEIKRFVLGSKENWLSETNDRFYDEPVIRFAASNDPLFEAYKAIIGEHHLTPNEAFELAFGKDSFREGTVISVILPINKKIIQANRVQQKQASKEWILLRTFGDKIFIDMLTRYMEGLLNQLGHRTIAPSHAEWFKVSGSASGPTSNWSERHIAYAAGHGTFSINDGFITEKGIAIRLTSVVTELKLMPDVRTAKTHTANCLLCSTGMCGACIKRCPVGALSEKGHDKVKCLGFVYGEESKKLAASYGADAKLGSCGLCQTKVPCEGTNPMSF